MIPMMRRYSVATRGLRKGTLFFMWYNGYVIIFRLEFKIFIVFIIDFKGLDISLGKIGLVDYFLVVYL
jgi:hypothetical protein